MRWVPARGSWHLRLKCSQSWAEASFGRCAAVESTIADRWRAGGAFAGGVAGRRPGAAHPKWSAPDPTALRRWLFPDGQACPAAHLSRYALLDSITSHPIFEL